MLLTLFSIGVVVFAVAYKLYGNYQRRIYGLKDETETPAVTMNDGVDYCPAHPSVVLGHHFASIAGAGPIVGPIAAAAMFGWLPAYIWILIGCVFFGGVHDMGALVASIRHEGLSIGEVVSRWIGKRGKLLFLIFTWLALTLVIAVFLELASQTMVADPAVAFSSVLYVFVAMIFGVLIYRFGISLLTSTLIMVPIVLGAVFYGHSAEWVQTMFKLDISTWRIILVIYIIAASIMPVWLLLQPRDYLASYLLYFSLGIGAIGMLFGSKFEVQLPAFKGWVNAGGDWMWPLLFITVACGAISGFHALVGSGTSSKQICKENDTVPVGYGAMLIEGLVAIIALGTLMIANADLAKKAPTVIYGAGIGQFAELIGLERSLGTSIGLLALNSFILTSLDTATRLARYQLQELSGMRLDRFSATGIGVGIALALVFMKADGKAVWSLIWPIFGASNQMVAAMALLTLGVWIKKGLKKDATFVMVPMMFMLITTIAALIQMIIKIQSNMLIGGMAVVILILSFMLCKEAWNAWSSKETN